MGVYYRPPDQEEEVDEAFYHTARHMQSRRFLHSIDDNILTKVVEESARGIVLLDLALRNKGLVEDVKVGDSLGCSHHEMVEFRILHGGSRAISKIKTLDFKRDNFGLFKDLLGGIPWVRGLKGRGVQDS